AGNGPGRRGVLRWKRSASLKESSTSAVLKGAVAASGVLQPLDHQQAVQSCLPAQDCSFDFMIIALELSPQIKPSRSTPQRSNPVVRECLAGVHVTDSRRKAAAEPSISREKTGSHPCHRHQPGSVGGLELERAGPDGLLIEQKILQERHTQRSAVSSGRRCRGALVLLLLRLLRRIAVFANGGCRGRIVRSRFGGFLRSRQICKNSENHHDKQRSSQGHAR